MTKPNTLEKPKPRRVTISKAAAYAGVSRWTLASWIEQGKLPYLRYPSSQGNGSVIKRIDLDDLDAFIRKSRDRNA